MVVLRVALDIVHLVEQPALAQSNNTASMRQLRHCETKSYTETLLHADTFCSCRRSLGDTHAL